MKHSRRDFIKHLSLATAGVAGVLSVSAKNLVKADVPLPSLPSDKISVFSKNLQWLGYDQMAQTAKQIGFDGIDLTVRPNGHVLPDNVSVDLPKAVAAVRKTGLEVYEITTAITEAHEPYTEAIFSVMRDLGIRYYRLNWFNYDQIISMPENLSRIKIRMQKLASLNEKYGVHGAYQNHSGISFGASVWDLYEVLKDLDPQYIGCQFDVRHATVEGGNSWVNDFKIIQPYVRSYNLKDFMWVKKADRWVAQSVPVGEGMVDFQKYFELVKLYNVKGPISIHYEYPLGGADQGASSLSISQETVIEAMRKDLTKVRSYMN